ncbi:hypothetical protein V495_06526 [Pseudogymnoascus sp. VKM F-4514 (FW-929)]|nr:hypothetical protein V495_06526 [Pseudogymnoascus sp. VKM F-4514 (FW-929)]KFY51181.1 hypothetical protein V497_09294 [Pseudogymnoascus sp. VKM F-4516 (FW-969)]
MLSFHLIIFGLLVGIHSLQSGVAACTDITCGGEFLKAGDGYAQRPDGCSSVTENPDQVRDSWGSANFGGVCDEHDRCYYTIRDNPDGCNNNFCGGLINACRKAYCSNLFGCLPVAFESCTAIAGTYCALVRAAAFRIFPDAQRKQKGYETCIAKNGGVCSPLQPPPPVLCSNGRPEGAMWIENLDGSRCLTTYYACRNGKIIVTRSYRAPHCIEL